MRSMRLVRTSADACCSRATSTARSRAWWSTRGLPPSSHLPSARCAHWPRVRMCTSRSSRAHRGRPRGTGSRRGRQLPRRPWRRTGDAPDAASASGALRVTREPADAASLAMAERLKVEVPRRVDESWLVLEDKGPALTFHFRGAPDIDAARAACHRRGRRDRPRPSAGAGRWPAGPRVAPRRGHHQGRCSQSAHRSAAAGGQLMLGDDRHDAEAFDALRHARTAGRTRGLAIAVAGHAEVTRASGAACRPGAGWSR